MCSEKLKKNMDEELKKTRKKQIKIIKRHGNCEAVVSVVVHFCNPITWKAETGRCIEFKTSKGYMVPLCLKNNKIEIEAERSIITVKS